MAFTPAYAAWGGAMLPFPAAEDSFASEFRICYSNPHRITGREWGSVPANFCMSLRTSAHTGVAIRVPAEKRDKLVAVGANSQLFRIRLKCCFLSCSTARRSGLPRRFAPRNDMQRTVTRTHSKYVSRHSPGSARVLRRHPANFCMSLRTSAHTGVAIRSPCGGTWQIAALKANS